MKVEINSEEKHKIVSIFKTYATIKEKCRSLISQKIFEYIQEYDIKLKDGKYLLLYKWRNS